MDIDRILQTRILRATRSGRPFEIFYGMYSEALLVEKSNPEMMPTEFRWILEKQSVITMITAVEVYFRDTLDGIFRLCKPSAFQSALKDLHKAKYDIDELIEFHVKGVHPCELIVDSFNFQNPDAIASVFTRLIGKPLWKSVFGMRFRVKEQPDAECEFDSDLLVAFQRSLQLRHELIHNPNLNIRKLKASEWSGLHSVATLVLGCDIIIGEFISKNLDAEIKLKNPVSN